MGGIMGEYIRAMPIVITVVLLASLFESAFILPTHLAHTPLKQKSKSRLIQFFEKTYRKRLLFVLKNKYKVIAAFVVTFIIAVGVILPLLGFNLFPNSDDNLLMIKIDTPKGTPLR